MSRQKKPRKMLSASKLKDFLDLAKTKVPAIKQVIRVVSDDDVSKHTSNIKSSDPGVVLIGILPSFGLELKNKDNYRHNNKMMFFIVDKRDARGGEEEFFSIYDETAAVVMDFEKWMFAESEKFPCPAIFKEIEFATFNADPVRDYYNLCGYMITFDLKTK